MNITELFQRHFTQCQDSEAEFHYNGTPFKGAWPKAQSMPLFIKDLMDEADHERDGDYASIADAKKHIKELEDEFKELEKEISALESDVSSLEDDNEKLESENADLQSQIEKLEAELSNKD